MSLLASVSEGLGKAGIAHAVIGATALAAHGVARATLDVDLLATETAALDAGVWAELGACGVQVEVRRGDADDPFAGVVRLVQSGEAPVDVVVAEAAWQRDIVARATPTRIAGAEVPVVGLVDLVALKLYGGSPQDLWDVERLVSVSRDPADLIARVEAALPRLPEECRRAWSSWKARRGPH